MAGFVAAAPPAAVYYNGDGKWPGPIGHARIEQQAFIAGFSVLDVALDLCKKGVYQCKRNL